MTARQPQIFGVNANRLGGGAAPAQRARIGQQARRDVRLRAAPETDRPLAWHRQRQRRRQPRPAQIMRRHRRWRGVKLQFQFRERPPPPRQLQRRRQSRHLAEHPVRAVDAQPGGRLGMAARHQATRAVKADPPVADPRRRIGRQPLQGNADHFQGGGWPLGNPGQLIQPGGRRGRRRRRRRRRGRPIRQRQRRQWAIELDREAQHWLAPAPRVGQRIIRVRRRERRPWPRNRLGRGRGWRNRRWLRRGRGSRLRLRRSRRVRARLQRRHPQPQSSATAVAHRAAAIAIVDQVQATRRLRHLIHQRRRS